MTRMNKDFKNSELEPWNAKIQIAENIVPIIKGYRDLIASESSYSVPNWVVDDGESLNEKEIKQRWLNYLDIMIKAFELELEGEVINEVLRKEQNYGLTLFAKYYVHLWD